MQEEWNESFQVHFPEFGEPATSEVADRVQVSVRGPGTCVDHVVVDTPRCGVGNCGPVAVTPFKEFKARVSGQFVGQVDGCVVEAGPDEGASTGDARIAEATVK